MRKFVPLIAFSLLTSVNVSAESLPPEAVSVDTHNPQVQEQAKKLAREPATLPSDGHRIVEDRSGRKQADKASTYSGHFQGRKMANGGSFDQHGQAAASKTLPLGTVAKVTNVETGRTAVVKVEDRGPYVDGRIVDVTKSTAEQLGIGSRQGVAPVVVAPIAVPQPDGSVKPGAGAMPGPATAQ